MNLAWQEAVQAVVHHPLFFVFITLAVFQLAQTGYEKTRSMFLQPVLVSMLVIIALLTALGVDYQEYKQGTSMLTILLGPATVVLAVPLFLNLRRVRAVFWPVVITLGCAGLLATVLGFGLAWLFGADELIVKTMAPKSVTTPIAMLVADELGGSASLAAVFVMITGVLGAMLGVELLRLFNIKTPAAVGIALGISAHAVGTARALQEGNEQGAFAALAMSIMGLLTAVLMPLLASIII